MKHTQITHNIQRTSQTNEKHKASRICNSTNTHMIMQVITDHKDDQHHAKYDLKLPNNNDQIEINESERL